MKWSWRIYSEGWIGEQGGFPTEAAAIKDAIRSSFASGSEIRRAERDLRDSGYATVKRRVHGRDIYTAIHVGRQP